MPHYRFRLLQVDGSPMRSATFPFADDHAAIRYATIAARGELAELWSGDRIVWRQPGAQPVP